MKKIPLTKGASTIVDDTDYKELSKYKWCLTSNGYAARAVYTYSEGGGYGTSGNYKKTTVLMHRVVNKTPDHLLTDHINRNRLDNRRKNLRSCTSQENTTNKSRYDCKGICYVRKLNKYIARIQKDKKRITLGYFKEESEAIAAYQQAATRFYA